VKDEEIIAAIQFEIKLFNFFLPVQTAHWLYSYGHIL